MFRRLNRDETHWPLIVLTAPVQWGDETVARYAEETARVVAYGQPFALLLDLTHSALLPAATRRKLAAHRRWLFDNAGPALLCEAIAVRSRAQREIFTIEPEFDPRGVQCFFATRDEAMTHCQQVLDDQGAHSLPPPSGPLTLRPLRKATTDDPTLVMPRGVAKY